MAGLADTSRYVDEVVTEMDDVSYLEDVRTDNNTLSNGATVSFDYRSNSYALNITHIGSAVFHGVEDSEKDKMIETHIGADTAGEVPGSIKDAIHRQDDDLYNS
nr:MAG: hypothetical protein J07AB56_08060 [Candidatus Nanosalinarum sp. J07AB56]